MKNEFTALISKIFNKNRELGLIHVSTEDEKLDGRSVTIKGKELVYYGNCSYMGLETDERIKAASIEAVKKYGSQFSCSRTFLQMGMYEEAEYLLGKIFEKPVLLAPTTSLGHISTIPVIISDRDAILVDQQAHNSIRNAIQMVKADGVYVETLPHNRMDKLETRIQILRQNYDKVWYFTDGVYSMYGDIPPFNELNRFLNQYEQFHCYIDDAHGMSWTGKHGRGLTLENMPYHPHLMLTTSLAKGFANCGGALVFNDEEQKMLIKNCGSSFIFSGPLQPAILGGIIETAKIHLTEEIGQLQNSLFEKMLFFVEYSKSLNLPLVSTALTPIFYMGVGKPEVGFKLSKYFAEQGVLCNLAQFPAVSVNNAGMRITLTNHHLKDIRHLLDSFSQMLPKLLEEEGMSYEDIYTAFNIGPLKQSEQQDKRKAA
ncbi:MAG: aminotransferase class I/II-fold pyridoxal phosphate-dependent enzyme [Bacteroidota bacterium]